MTSILSRAACKGLRDNMPKGPFRFYDLGGGGGFHLNSQSKLIPPLKARLVDIIYLMDIINVIANWSEDSTTVDNWNLTNGPFTCVLDF